MHCEVEFLAVGEGSKAGDAIIVRYGEQNDFKLMMVDGGTAAAGEDAVAHLRKHFGDDVELEHVVLTHSDADHASGLREIIRKIPVRNLWLHIPWLESNDAVELFKGNWSPQGLSNAIKDKYDIIAEIVELGLEAGCTFHDPFQGAAIGPFVVLSPSRATYLYLLPQFDKTPEPKQELIEEAVMWIGKQPDNFLAKMMEAVTAKIQKWVKETWNYERLKDGGVTSASNESSVILYANLEGGEKLLLTGDAGINALWWAIEYAQQVGYPLREFNFVQIPHHGSRRNVGPTVLNELIGPIQPEGVGTFSAFVSAPKDDDQHPRRIVLNAFVRRGGNVVATQGLNKVHWGGFTPRPGYVDAETIGLSGDVEDYD